MNESVVRRCAVCIGMALVSGMSIAAEGYRLRAPSAGAFGAEMGVPLALPGLYLNTTLSYTRVRGVAGDTGGTLTTSPLNVPLPTAAATGGAIPNGSFLLHVPAGTVDLAQEQTQLNVVATYLTALEPAGGRVLLRANLPLVSIHRSFGVKPGGVAGITPLPASPPLTPAALTAVNVVGNAVLAQVQSASAAAIAAQNGEISGLGDLELTAAWLKEFGRLRLAAVAGMYLPTGTYNPNRGPNPGFGDFHTTQLGLAALYGLDAGLSVGARASWATNSANRVTHYRSGDYAVFEGVVRKDWTRLAVGMDLMATRQLQNDSAPAGVAVNPRLRNYSAAPFVSWRLSRTMSITAEHAQTFGARNAQISNTTFVRLDASM